MTRTARAAYPRAVLKDRSECRSGRDTSLRKAGAGQHNWGSIADERRLESAALEDELADEGMDEEELETPNSPSVNELPEATASPKRELSPGKANFSEEELEKARQYRTHTFKRQGDIDLIDIARTSAAVSGSPPLSPGLARSMSQDNKDV